MMINYDEKFAANDYIELIAYQNSGAGLGKYSASAWDCNMSVQYIGAA